jgi:hypothetical protein
LEDRAHEAFLVPLLKRVALEEDTPVSPRVRSARGGHARALSEFALYQNLLVKKVVVDSQPDILIVAIDGNCSPFAKARKDVAAAKRPDLSCHLVVACPDPHVERWFLADPESFKAIVGYRPGPTARKCRRDHYKHALADAIRQAHHQSPLGGIEFAQELVDGMNMYRAGKNDHSLKAFVDELRSALRTVRS